MNQIAKLDLSSERDGILAILPKTANIDRFMEATSVAIASKPELVQADRLSLWKAIKQAANDGLVPDGKEGVINVYPTKIKIKDQSGKWQEQWVQMCVWIPMTLGLRKRAIELASLYISAEVVHEHDHFKVVRGDDAKIEHADAPLGKPRGRMVGAYAIFKKLMPDGQLVIVHREVMDATQIAKVKSRSKAQNGDLWTTFEDEAWRKTVARRGIKSVPAVPDALMSIFRRDDEMFSFRSDATEVEAETAGAGQLPMPPKLPAPQAKPVPMPPVAAEEPEPVGAAPEPQDGELFEEPSRFADIGNARERAFLEKLMAKFQGVNSKEELERAYKGSERTIEDKLSRPAKQAAFDLFDEYAARF